MRFYTNLVANRDNLAGRTRSPLRGGEVRIGRCGRRLPITRSSDRGAVYGCRILLALLFAVAAAGCNKDEFITQEIGMAPVVAFDANPAIYTVKVGREFTIAPDYRYVDRAVYAWKLESTGKIV